MINKIRILTLGQNRQNGVTVVEVMIAVALSLIILAGVMHIFLNNKKTYRVQEAFARLQENGRFAMQFLTEDIRMVGYAGCASVVGSGSIKNIANYYPKDSDPDEIGEMTGNGIEGFEYNNLPLNLIGSSNLNAVDVVPNTDIIRIKGGTPTGAKITPPWQAKGPVPASTMLLDPTTAAGLFSQYDILFVSDCSFADVFVASTVNSLNVGGDAFTAISFATSTNTTNKLSTTYGNDAEIMKFKSTAYYLGYGASGEPSLFRRSLGNAGTIITEELVEGVEDMQVLYGEDTDGNGTPNIYVDSSSVGDMTRVVSVRISIQLRSASDNLATKTSNKGDKRLRRTFTTLVAIRNRIT